MRIEGNLLVSAGVVELKGDLKVSRDYDQPAAGRLVVEVRGTGAGEFGRLNVKDTRTLAGEVEFVMAGGYVPAAGDKVDFLVGPDPIVGAFGNANNVAGRLGNLMYTLLYLNGANPTIGRMLVAKIPDLDDSGCVDDADWNLMFKRLGTDDDEADIDDNGIVDVEDLRILEWVEGYCPGGDEGCPGDVNGDGFVDAIDLLLVQSMLNQPCDGCPEDINGDGFVDAEDELIVILNWGACP